MKKTYVNPRVEGSSSINEISNPKVSVIVPVHKVEFYLSRCLKSICNQTLTDIEIIIVDEGEHDQCRVITDEYMSHDNRICALHEGGGYGKCVNAGIAHARGEYVGIVESDDFIEPNMYELLYRKAKELNAEIVKSPFLQYYDDQIEEPARLMIELIHQLPEDRCFSLWQYPIMLSTHPSVWAGIYNSEWLKSSGIRFIGEGAYLDIVFRLETLSIANRIAWIPDYYYHWRITNPFSTNAKWNVEAAIQRWETILSRFDNNEEWKHYEKYLLPEAVINLFIHYSPFKSTYKQMKRIKKIRKHFSDSSVKECLIISSEDKRKYLGKNMEYLMVCRFLYGLFDR